MSVTFQKEIREYDRVIGFAGTNDKGQLIVRTPGHGWEIMEGVNTLTPEIAEKVKYSMSAVYYSNAGYM